MHEGAIPGVPVLAWVEDPVELFFLQIQGSGQIAARDRASASASVSPTRTAIRTARSGRYLVDRGELALEQASMQGIKAWARGKSGKARGRAQCQPELCVLSRVSDSADGPVGSLGVALTAGYSIAVDPRFVPLGAPVFLATTLPLSTEPLERLSSRRTRAARFAARCARISSGGPARPRERRRVACASRVRCGCCGRAASRCPGKNRDVPHFSRHGEMGYVPISSSAPTLRRAGPSAARRRPPRRRSPLARNSVGVLLTPSLRPSVEHLVDRVVATCGCAGDLGLPRSARSSQAFDAVGRAPDRARMLGELGPDHRIHEVRGP